MKARIIMSVMVSSLLVLVTSIEAQGGLNKGPVLDYRTGNPIRKQDEYFIRALWNGSEFDFSVDKMGFPYIRLKSGPPPSRFVGLSQHDFAQDKSDTVRVSIQYHVKFRDSITYWSNIGEPFRIAETAYVVRAAAEFTFEETEENRVYKMVNHFSRSTKHEVGMQVKNENKEDKYYLATIRTHNNFGTPITKAEASSLKHPVRFTFQKP